MLPDSNVYGPVAGLWTPSNPFHSPRRETLYSLPYQLRTKQRQGNPLFPPSWELLPAIESTGE